MRGQNALRASFQPPVCIFCSLGFAARPTSLLARGIPKSQRRCLNSSRSPYQSAGAATAQVQENEEPSDGNQGSQSSFDGHFRRYNFNNQQWAVPQPSQTVSQTPQSPAWSSQASEQNVSNRRNLSPAEERARQSLLERNTANAQDATQTRDTGMQQQQSSRRLTAAEEQARQALFGGTNHNSQQATQSQDYGRLQERADGVRSQYQEQSLRGSHMSKSRYYRTEMGNRTQERESFAPGFRIRYQTARDYEDNRGSDFDSIWHGLTPEAKRGQNAPPQTASQVVDTRPQSQKRWQTASNSAFVPLSEQRQNDALSARFARRACFRCGSTEHLARDCSLADTRNINPGSQPRYEGQSASERLFGSNSQRWDRRENEAGQDVTSQSNTQSQPWQQPEPKSEKSMDSFGWAPRQRDKKEKDRRRSNFLLEDEFDKMPSKAERDSRKALKAEKAARKAEKKTQGAPLQIEIPAFISVTNLATLIKVRTEDLAEKMAELGYGEVAHDEVLNADNAGLIAMEYNYEAIPERDPAVHDLLPQPETDDKSLLPMRPPVVTIMGHVDHGKTTILDYLRKSSVAAGEFGGITQHIGAFSVPLASGKLITFLDTPGHAAFEVMRKRGATVTDIVVLVVAADDSVKPQTIEAIKHAKGAGVPIIVAINKMDKEEANPERVKGDLARHGVDVEDFGGDTQVVCVSGKTGLGIEDLEESIVTQSEILDHRAETNGMVEGWVLESTTKRAGRVAAVLVKRGTLRAGDILVAGTTWARARVLRNEAGAQVRTATPGTPIEVDGWRTLPAAGDQVLQAPNEQKATDVVAFREEKAERVKLALDMEAINEARRLEQEKREREATAAAAESDTNGNVGPPPPPSPASEARDEAAKKGPEDVHFIVKGDVAGSVEAILDSLAALAHPEVRPHILRSGVGPASEFDVEHAAAAGGYIVCFNTTVEPGLVQMAERRGVGLIEQNVIYRLVDEVKAKLTERLKPTVSIRVLGEAEVSQLFEIGVGGRKKMKIAGCKVRNGVVSRSAKARVLRGNRETVFDGTLSSLKNIKKDVSEMRKGTECGMGFENWEDFEIGDQIQCYEEKIEKRSL